MKQAKAYVLDKGLKSAARSRAEAARTVLNGGRENVIPAIGAFPNRPSLKILFATTKTDLLPRRKQIKEVGMSQILIGNHSKITAAPSDQAKIRKFYRTVLGCKQTKKTDTVDFFRLGDNFFITILYQESALDSDSSLKSIWLELQTDDPPTLGKKILDFGVRPLEVFDKEHLYFQAPGGQVFRLVKIAEDLSRFEQ